MFEKFYTLFVRACYIFGMAALIASLPHSKIAMSISQFILAATFAVERFNLRKIREFSKKPAGLIILMAIPFFFQQLFTSIFNGFRAFARNKPALIFSSILLLHAVGLIFTTDFDYALKDLRTKLPLFLLPLYISTTQAFGRKHFYWFMLLFIASLLVRTFINTSFLYAGQYIDIRDISRSISHIIISLLISFALFTLAYFINKKREFSLLLKIAFSLVFVWFIIYLVIIRSATGLITSIITMMIFLAILVFKSRSMMLKAGLSLIIVVSVTAIMIYLHSVVSDYYRVKPVDLTHLDQFTAKGNRYVHNTKDLSTENGNYLWIYIQWDELRNAWGKRSPISIDSTDRKHQLILNTLVRYLTSKGLRKDAQGVESLSEQDVSAIENGVSNVIFTREFSFRGRIYEFLWGYDEYRKTGNPTGSSIMQRIEFWKASVGIIREHWLTGVGTGDMNEAFREQYEKMHTKLSPDQRWRSHDQFLSIFVGFGIFGLIWFLFALFYPPLSTGKFDDYFFLIFFIIAFISMITGDTIESQAGVTFFAFFYSFLLFGRKEEDHYEIIRGTTLLS